MCGENFKTGGLIAMRYDLRDMTRGNLWKQILVFSLPLMASNLLQVLFNMSDIAVVGQFAGSHALGSVGSTATLAALYSGFLIGMGAGVNVLTSNHDELKNLFQKSLRGGKSAPDRPYGGGRLPRAGADPDGAVLHSCKAASDAARNEG